MRGRKGLAYFQNPKLQAKVGIVALLTINGAILHKAVLPTLQRAGSLLHLPLSSRMVVVFTGVLSGVSWLYAAMLGIARPLNWKYSLIEILAAFPVLVADGFCDHAGTDGVGEIKARQHKAIVPERAGLLTGRWPFRPRRPHSCRQRMCGSAQMRRADPGTLCQ